MLMFVRYDLMAALGTFVTFMTNKMIVKIFVLYGLVAILGTFITVMPNKCLCIVV